jgi:hypothetical protein
MLLGCKNSTSIIIVLLLVAVRYRASGVVRRFLYVVWQDFNASHET